MAADAGLIATLEARGQVEGRGPDMSAPPATEHDLAAADGLKHLLCSVLRYTIHFGIELRRLIGSLAVRRPERTVYQKESL